MQEGTSHESQLDTIDKNKISTEKLFNAPQWIDFNKPRYKKSTKRLHSYWAIQDRLDLSPSPLNSPGIQKRSYGTPLGHSDRKNLTLSQYLGKTPIESASEDSWSESSQAETSWFEKEHVEHEEAVIFSPDPDSLFANSRNSRNLLVEEEASCFFQDIKNPEVQEEYISDTFLSFIEPEYSLLVDESHSHVKSNHLLNIDEYFSRENSYPKSKLTCDSTSTQGGTGTPLQINESQRYSAICLDDLITEEFHDGSPRSKYSSPSFTGSFDALGDVDFQGDAINMDEFSMNEPDFMDISESELESAPLPKLMQKFLEKKKLSLHSSSSKRIQEHAPINSKNIQIEAGNNTTTNFTSRRLLPIKKQKPPKIDDLKTLLEAYNNKVRPRRPK